MDWLNYHHLLYFWTVAREGSISRASARLRLSQPTISAQVHALEASLGERLLARSGRGLVLTDVGQLVSRYADEIFDKGREMQDALKGRPTGRPLRLVLGIADVLPKLIALRLIEPALALAEPVQLVCREDNPEHLIAELSTHALDLVLADAPIGPAVRVRAFNHLLGECGVSVFGTARLARRLRANFPASLDGAPFLLPMDNSALRRSLDQWFDAEGCRPKVVGEFEDNALLEVVAQTGAGVFAGPTAIEREIRQQYGVSVIGRLDAVRARFYAISIERKLRNPAALAIAEVGRRRLLGSTAKTRRRANHEGRDDHEG
jgi:LysR family transcriptional activator of nhaA